MRPRGQSDRTAHTDGHDTAQLPMARVGNASMVLVVHDVQGVRRFPLTASSSAVVGRSAEADICLTHPSISRHHARICLGGDLTVEDLGSLNGVWVDGERLPPKVPEKVVEGSSLKLGGVVAVVERASLSKSDEAEDGFVFQSGAMRRVMSQVEVYAKSHCAVLLLGETGVGKEVLAARIHALSPRANAPFVRLNCAALPGEMVEAELFGHERGAFTSAVASKPGLLEAANGGTVLLDEIGDLPLSAQAKLLRAVETMEVTRLGSVRPKKLNFRLISATNRDLMQASRQGQFRLDLYYRLSGVEVMIPPLRERPEDIPTLSDLFLRRACSTAACPPQTFAPDARALLNSHVWPGNVRELKSTVERAALLAEGPRVTAEHIIFAGEAFGGRSATATAPLGLVLKGAPFGKVLSHEGDFYQQKRMKEKEAILTALAVCNGNQTKAAEQLGMPRRTLTKRLTEYGIRAPRRGRGGRDGAPIQGAPPAY
ncbi:MAG: sigma 54-interacting transcriptional regulator [Polyangiaceae bacterium]|nr:sigma 54-interacting transcriptional regulator [Polyangiaceae bacterium]